MTLAPHTIHQNSSAHVGVDQSEYYLSSSTSSCQRCDRSFASFLSPWGLRSQELSVSGGRYGSYAVSEPSGTC